MGLEQFAAVCSWAGLKKIPLKTGCLGVVSSAVTLRRGTLSKLSSSLGTLDGALSGLTAAQGKADVLGVREG